MANGTTEDALAARINSLSGGAPLPQAATQTIARRLLGPAIADRYGDVIGTRPYGPGDVARDFALGAISGDPFKAQQLKAQVMENYRSELRREEDQAIQREEAARAQLTGFFQLLQQGKGVPKDLRKDFFQEGLSKLGIEATSPLFIKLLSNYEKFGDIYDALADPEVQRMADEDPLGAIEQLTTMGHDGAQALQLVKSVQDMKRYRAETQLIVSRAKRLGALTQEDPVSRRRANFIDAMVKQKRTDRLGRPRALTNEELTAIEATADRLYPRAAATGIAQPAEVAGPPAPSAVPGAAETLGLGPQATTTVTPTTSPEAAVTPTTTGPVGIAQAPSPAAAATQPAAAPKVRRLTGAVSRVE